MRCGLVPLLLCWVLLMDPQRMLLGSLERFKLSMEDNSIDDMYSGCIEDMKEQLVNFKDKTGLNVKEKTNPICQSVGGGNSATDLTPHERRAICLYTSNDWYKEFNKAVRSGKDRYGTSFKFHALHFWLTIALQKLNKLKNDDKCYTVYRRTKAKFTGEVNQVIRFGSFASTSLRNDLTRFGTETCFKIRTCTGADISRYSVYEGEKEVLIPPYETFKITHRHSHGQFEDLRDCKVVFVLENGCERSKLNCKLTGKSKTIKEKKCSCFGKSCFPFR